MSETKKLLSEDENSEVEDPVKKEMKEPEQRRNSEGVRENERTSNDERANDDERRTESNDFGVNSNLTPPKASALDEEADGGIDRVPTKAIDGLNRDFVVEIHETNDIENDGSSNKTNNAEKNLSSHEQEEMENNSSKTTNKIAKEVSSNKANNVKNDVSSNKASVVENDVSLSQANDSASASKPNRRRILGPSVVKAKANIERSRQKVVQWLENDFSTNAASGNWNDFDDDPKNKKSKKNVTSKKSSLAGKESEVKVKAKQSRFADEPDIIPTSAEDSFESELGDDSAPESFFDEPPRKGVSPRTINIIVATLGALAVVIGIIFIAFYVVRPKFPKISALGTCSADPSQDVAETGECYP